MPGRVPVRGEKPSSAPCAHQWPGQQGAGYGRALRWPWGAAGCRGQHRAECGWAWGKKGGFLGAVLHGVTQAGWGQAEPKGHSWGTALHRSPAVHRRAPDPAAPRQQEPVLGDATGAATILWPSVPAPVQWGFPWLPPLSRAWPAAPLRGQAPRAPPACPRRRPCPGSRVLTLHTPPSGSGCCRSHTP